MSQKTDPSFPQKYETVFIFVSKINNVSNYLKVSQWQFYFTLYITDPQMKRLLRRLLHPLCSLSTKLRDADSITMVLFQSPRGPQTKKQSLQHHIFCLSETMSPFFFSLCEDSECYIIQRKSLFFGAKTPLNWFLLLTGLALVWIWSFAVSQTIVFFTVTTKTFEAVFAVRVCLLHHHIHTVPFPSSPLLTLDWRFTSDIYLFINPYGLLFEVGPLERAFLQSNELRFNLIKSCAYS